jgi:ribulose-phosphate 3-epimerase
MNKIQVAPSLFAADFYNLSEAVNLFEKADVDLIHFDVMDNHFVPNLSLGPKVIGDILARTRLPANVHLMVELENGYGIEPFLELPVQNITVHLEASPHIRDYLKKIRDLGKSPGISVKPGTSVESVTPYLDDADMVLLMSVEPGFSGQKFMPESLERVKKLKSLIAGRKIRIQIDGGIGRGNIELVTAAGADCLVIGSAFYSDKDPVELVKWVHSL